MKEPSPYGETIMAAAGAGSGSGGGRVPTPDPRIGTEATLSDMSFDESARTQPLPRDPLVGRDLKKSYRMRRVIGRGAMGVVYEAEQVGLGRRVAVKVLAAEVAGNPIILARFQQEARALARLSSPNIVTVHDYGITDEEPYVGHPYLVMEYVEGTTLEKPMDEYAGRGMPLESAASYLVQILAAIRESHAKGIVHRDLKPGNVLIAGEVAKVCDFGLVKESGGERRTIDGALLGTILYMSPEQLRGEAVDHRSDLYSAGIIFYEMLAGRLAHRVAEGMMVQLHICLNEEPPPLISFRPELAPGVDAFIRRAILKNREQRFQSAQEMLAALLDLMGEQGSFAGLGARASVVPTFTAPVPLVQPKERNRRKRPIGVVLGILLVFALVLAAVGFLVSSREDRSTTPTLASPTATGPAPPVASPASPLEAPAPPLFLPIITAADPLAVFRSQCLRGLVKGKITSSAARESCADYVRLASAGDRYRAVFQLALGRRARRAARVRAPLPAPAPVPEPEVEEPAPEEPAPEVPVE